MVWIIPHTLDKFEASIDDQGIQQWVKKWGGIIIETIEKPGIHGKLYELIGEAHADWVSCRAMGSPRLYDGEVSLATPADFLRKRIEKHYGSL